MSQTNPETDLKLLNLGIRNFIHGIDFQNRSFVAMDIKVSAFLASLGLLIVVLSQSGYSLELKMQLGVLASVSHTLKYVLLVSVLANIVCCMICLKARRIEIGVLKKKTLDGILSQEEPETIFKEIYIKLGEAYEENRRQLVNKDTSFDKAQTLWFINISLMVAIILIGIFL